MSHVAWRKIAGAMLAVQHLRDREDGQALAEYALIIGLIALVCVAALTTLGLNVASKLNGVANAFKGA
jgi:Flp pilus assembly pilin Flp